MILIDMSSILHRVSNGATNSIKHATTSTPHGYAVGDLIYNISYVAIGRVSHVFDEYNFVIELQYTYGSKSIVTIDSLNIENLEFLDNPLSSFQYPFSSFKTTFLNVFFHNIKNMKQKFPSHKNIIFCLDNPTLQGYWRKDYLPEYKAQRKAAKEKHIIDFKSLYTFINNELLPFIKETTSMSVVEYPRAEGDDVIGIIAKHYSYDNKITVISEDKDLIQLGMYPNLIFYRPMLDRFSPRLDEDGIEHYIKKHTIMGDSSDNVMSIGHCTRYHAKFIKFMKENYNIKLEQFKIEEFELYTKPTSDKDYDFKFASYLNKTYDAKVDTKYPIYVRQDFAHKLEEFELLLHPKTKEEYYSEFLEIERQERVEKAKATKESEKIQGILNESEKAKKIATLDGTINRYMVENDNGELVVNPDLLYEKELHNWVFHPYGFGAVTVETFLADFDNKILENPHWKSRYELNKTLVDLREIPKDIEKGVLSAMYTTDEENIEAFEQYLVNNNVNNYKEVLQTLCKNYRVTVKW